MTDFPKLRPVEAFQAQVSGKDVVCVRDATGFVDHIIAVPVPVFYLFPFMDGNHSIRDIQAEFMRTTGEMVTSEQVAEIIASLDEHYLLDTERFAVHRENAMRDFSNETIRKATHAGLSYESEPEALKRQLDTYFENIRDRQDSRRLSSRAHITGLVVPHIDIRAGGPCYASAFKCLSSATQSPERVVILGTAHRGLENLFAATRKDFETPLGISATDQAFLDRLSEVFGDSLFSDEFAHRAEHVIEFQVTFLQHSFSSRVKIVPILCSFDHSMVDGESFPNESRRIQSFCRALKTCIEEFPGTCVIASADLSHLGPLYGDPEGLDEKGILSLEQGDNEILQSIESGSASGFAEAIRKNDNATRICGFPPIYTMLSVLGDQRGLVLDYGGTQMDEHGSVVTFASVVFSPDLKASGDV
ncbi:MAG TPA: AmmeMemoRadiSam system protein B [bacterium]|nr:AmmeMemoRadiSam system protein B [bacterium]